MSRIENRFGSTRTVEHPTGRHTKANGTMNLPRNTIGITLLCLLLVAFLAACGDSAGPTEILPSAAAPTPLPSVTPDTPLAETPTAPAASETPKADASYATTPLPIVTAVAASATQQSPISTPETEAGPLVTPAPTAKPPDAYVSWCQTLPGLFASRQYATYGECSDGLHTSLEAADSVSPPNV